MSSLTTSELNFYYDYPSSYYSTGYVEGPVYIELMYSKKFIKIRKLNLYLPFYYNGRFVEIILVE